ncbi:Conserved_hypothetical protein [Hexamita inflata]|uniref:Uncharacterized protein n=1 Tax=Hexamita inflata TaxID=28002 RepID=A0AA86UWW3_9EUKA|nr:Conserved hypothetical protein [Hexamita inflata]
METILWSSAENMDQLMSKEFRGKECILIENVIHTKLDYVPLAVKYLTIRSCNLLSLKGMHLPNLEYLDVSSNPLYSLCEISTTKLVTLIISNTSVADIAPVATIKTLKHFRAENCFIVNFLPLIQHFNFTVQWLSAQFVPDLKHFQMILNPKEDENEAEKIMSALLEFKNESDYTVKMILRYANTVENGELKVENDEEITTFRFTDYINAFKAMFDKCCNIVFENTPKKLKELSITNSHLTSVEGVQNMTELELVNFNSNDLLFIDPIKALTKLKQVFVDGNMLHDLKVIKNLPNFAYNAIQKQRIATMDDYKKILKNQFSEIKAKELMEVCKNNQKFDEEFVYDTKMISQLKPHVQGKNLKIINNQDLNSIQFIDQLNIDELNIQNCKNVTCQRIPKFIQKLIINNCQLTTEKLVGIEQIEKITSLDLGLNALTDNSLNVIAEMKTLVELNLSLNRLENVEKLKQLTLLKQLDLNQNRIKDISSFNQLINLQNFDGSYNNLSQVSLQDMNRLKVLNLSNNQIYSIDGLQNLANLVYLNLSNNLIGSLEFCKDLRHLIDIRVHGNSIKDYSPILNHTNYQLIWQEHIQQNIHEIDNTDLTPKESTDIQQNLILKVIQKTEQIIRQDNNNQNQSEYLNCKFYDKLQKDNLDNIIFNMTQYNYVLKSVNTYLLEYLIKLNLSSLRIRYISLLKELVHLTYLNLSNNNIYNINSLKQLIKLHYLNLNNNRIIICAPLKHICNVTDLRINKNLINDLETVTKMKYFKHSWIQNYSHQHELTVYDYQQYLDNSSIILSQTMMDSLNEQRNTTSDIIHDSFMCYHYKNQIYDKKLVIENEQKLNSIAFIDQLDVQELTVIQCDNLIFQRVSFKITNLTINKCKLYHLNGIENMKQLSYLNLNNNKLLIIEQISKLNNLKSFQADYNMIQDFQFKPECAYYQNKPQKIDYENYIQATKYKLSVQQLIANFREKTNKTDQLLLDLSKYEHQLLNKFKTQVKNGRLLIQFDNDIKFLKFLDQLLVTQVQIKYCTNIQFSRAPYKVTSLTINYCGLIHLTGISGWLSLIELNLANNKLGDISELGKLKQITKLDLSFNGLLHVHDLQFLDQLTQLNLNNNQLSNLSGLAGCKQLVELSLSHNNLEDISELSALSKLLSVDLSHNRLGKIDDLVQLTQLISLNLNYNKLLFIQPISALTSLKVFSADYNYISDFNKLSLMPNFKQSFVYFQNTAQPSDYQYYLRFNPQLSLQSLLSEISLNQQANEHIINEYEKRMTVKYRPIVGAEGPGTLYISNDPDLKDFAFTDQFNLPNYLIIQNCPNIQFKRTPIKIKRLRICKCDLKSVSGIEKMTQLTYLSLYSNQLTQVNWIKNLTQLQILDLQNNNIVNIEGLRALTGLQTLQLQNNKIQSFEALQGHPNRKSGKYQLELQTIPTLQEIAEQERE